MSETNDTTNDHYRPETPGSGVQETADGMKWTPCTRKRRVRSRPPLVAEVTGDAIADSYLAGLRLTPRFDCGDAHLEGTKLIFDPTRPLSVQLREIADQTARWCNRRGLRIVHAEPDNIPGSTEDATVTSRHCRPQLRLFDGGLCVQARRRCPNGETFQ